MKRYDILSLFGCKLRCHGGDGLLPRLFRRDRKHGASFRGHPSPKLHRGDEDGGLCFAEALKSHKLILHGSGETLYATEGG